MKQLCLETTLEGWGICCSSCETLFQASGVAIRRLNGGRSR